jgi:hypothetical protein
MSGLVLAGLLRRDRSMNKLFRQLVLGSVCAASGLLVPTPAFACGGFFCSQTAPVNQSAERIVFAANGDGTVTAVIEIQYEGPSASFSWLLPISSVPTSDQIAVASDQAFQRLQQATNPQYNLTTRVEGTCAEDDSRSFNAAGQSVTPSAGPGSTADHGGVTVAASGVIGSFEYAVISLDASLTDPAAAAVTWLGKNGYDVPEGAPGLLGPYLADGMNLLALRLKKGASVGSIRPIALTYDAAKPMIPIKLTAVAANDDMGVMTWILSDAQAVPKNYNALELNEARINWFNASANYNDVVTAAANDAGGQGFVTEFAKASTTLKDVVWSASEEQAWQQYKQSPGASADEVFQRALQSYATLDGFGDVVRDNVTLPAAVTLDQLQSCPYCYSNLDVTLVPADFVAALELNVIKPARLVQDLIDAHPQLTRLYTTLSAAEMTVDPLFTFNPDLADVDNVHTAERVIECGPGYYQNGAPWRIELPHGGTLRGGPTEVGVWPVAFDAQPANQRILRQGESGSGKVLEDNTAKISQAVTTYGNSLAKPQRHTTSGCSVSSTPVSGSLGRAWAGLGFMAFAWRRARERRRSARGLLLGLLSAVALSRRRRRARAAPST